MDKIKAVWESASVERLHATPHHTPYPVGLHCYRMLVLLYMLHPKPSDQLVRAIVFHDSAERWIGDVPATSKWFVAPEINVPLTNAEDRVLETLHVLPNITSEEHAWLKALDLAELYLYCLDERDMGNRNLIQCRAECQLILEQEWVPYEIRHYLSKTDWERTDDSFEMRS